MKYSTAEIENRTSDYVCIPCGRLFLKEEQKDIERVLTFHEDICCLCKNKTGVTHIRAYNYLRVE